MEITDIRVFPVDEEKLKAYVTIVIDACFMISDIKVIHGTSGLFVSMPSKRRKNGTYRDVAHPLNSDTRRMLEDQILSKYEQALAKGLSRQRTPREADDDFSADHDFDRPVPDDSSTRTRPEIPGL